MPEPAARRRKTVALVLSGIFPGLGQLYNRQPFKGAVFVALGLVLSWLTGRAVPTRDGSWSSAPWMRNSPAGAPSGPRGGLAPSIQPSFPRNRALAPPSARDAA